MGSVVYDVLLLDDGYMGSSIVSPVVQDMQGQQNFGLQLNFTGTPTGVFTVQVSGDYLPGTGTTVLRAGKWINIPVRDIDGNSPLASGAADTHMFILNNIPGPFLRVLYTPISGSGSLDIWITGKDA